MCSCRVGPWVVALLLGTQHSALSTAFAHPVPKRSHDRTIVVCLTPDAVVVEYRLELDEWTVVFVDLPAVSDKVDLSKLSKPSEFYEAFTRAYAPVFAGNLTAKLDGRELTFRPVERSHHVEPDHLHCEFRFRADWAPAPGTRHEFTFHEGNYELEAGRVRLALTNAPTFPFVSKDQPDEALQARPPTELRPGDDARLRKASAAFEVVAPAPKSAARPAEVVALLKLESAVEAPRPEFVGPPRPEPSPTESAGGTRPDPKPGEEVASAKKQAPAEPEKSKPQNTLTALLESPRGFWVLMFLAACFGAAHALTPGHGKTLVAAYLVGERGTVWHALYLGIVTTLTHTGAVLVLAALLPFLLPRHSEADVQTVLGLVGGLLVAGLGFWLLLRRLSGGADHFHLGGHGHHHHHHHHHGAADHYHDEHGHAHPLPASGSVGWWGLTLLGVTGGLVPCWDAILMLGLSARRLALALPLLLSFSAGLAGVLILIGMAVVLAKGFADSYLGEDGRLGRVVRALPLVSAALVTAIGLWLCYDSLHGGTHAQP